MQLVLDTNVVLDLLVFGDPQVHRVDADLRAGILHWQATAAMREELRRVLDYPKLAARVRHHCGAADAVLQAFDRRCAIVPEPPKAPLTCRDPDDQKFIDLAVLGRGVLLSKDSDVLRLRKRLARLDVTALSLWPAGVDRQPVE